VIVLCCCADGNYNGPDVAELVTKIKDLSHGQCHALITLLLKVYFGLWFQWLPVRDAVHGHMTITLEGDYETVDCEFESECTVSVLQTIDIPMPASNE
jgi:hypothetical protein